MSRGAGRLERRIGELFAATKDRALSISALASYAFELADGVAPDRKQRLSATRAAHRLVRRAAAAKEAVRSALGQVIAETAAMIGREPGGRGRECRYFKTATGYVAVDKAFAEVMETALGRPAYLQAWHACERERKRSGDALFNRRGGWRATETKDRRLWFHPADYPVRVWAVAIRPEGVVWADAEITGIDSTYVRVRYRGEPARLARKKLARAWTLYRGVYFTSAHSGFAANLFDEMWWQRYWRPDDAVPPAMQMALAVAIELLGVPADFTREDVIAAFRRKAMRCHPDHGGTEAQFIELMTARDRLLSALGTRAAPPKMPEFAPRGATLRYHVWRPASSSRQLGHTRRLALDKC
jgi:hypothetical protein